MYNQKSIMVGDLTRECQFQKIDSFWDSLIERVDFIENVMIIQTESAFYIAEIFNEHRFLVRNVKAVEGSVNTFRVGGYGSLILLLSNSAKKISTLQIIDENRKVLGAPKNPLQNEGLACCGGYSTTNGCVVSDSIQMTKINGMDTLNPQTLLANTYKPEYNTTFSVEKFQ